MAAPRKYKGTTFPSEGYAGTFEQFVAEFRSTRDFRRLDPKVRNVELKKAFDIAKKDAALEKPARAAR